MDDAGADEEVLAAREGDRQALEALLRREYPRILALCRRLAGNEADAADAAQEAMIAVARGVGRFDGRSRFSTWVYRVATNACLDELRRRSRRALPVEDLPDGDAPFMAGGPAGDVDDADLRLDVQDALLRLPLEFRAAVVLRDLCGLDYEEIATTLDIPVGTVRSRIARGRGALARILGGNRDESSERPTSQS